MSRRRSALAGAHPAAPQPADLAGGGEQARPAVVDADLVGMPTAKLALFGHRPDNPRWDREYDPAQDPELEQFGKTVDGFGILQAVTVTTLDAWLNHHPEHSAQFGPAVRFVVVMGNRRLAIARHKCLDSLPYLVNDKLARRGAVRMAGWIENYHRKQLDPIREAAELAAELADTGESNRALAERVGISHTQINARLQLLKLIPEFQALVSDEVLTVQKALPLTRLREAEQRQILEMGPPYQRSAIVADASASESDEGGNTLSTTRAVTIRRSSSPAQVAETLRAQLPPEILREVLMLLEQAGVTTSQEA